MYKDWDDMKSEIGNLGVAPDDEQALPTNVMYPGGWLNPSRLRTTCPSDTLIATRTHQGRASTGDQTLTGIERTWMLRRSLQSPRSTRGEE